MDSEAKKRKASGSFFRRLLKYEVLHDFREDFLNLHKEPVSRRVFPLRRCVECNGRLVLKNYIGSDMVYEVVCSECGLVHAVLGNFFYDSVMKKILESAERKK